MGSIAGQQRKEEEEKGTGRGEGERRRRWRRCETGCSLPCVYGGAVCSV
jgi:hypothetical protein